MHSELLKVARAQQLQAELDADEYVQQYIVRDCGPPDTYRGKQTQQKLDEIVRKCNITFTGKSFIDLGCNKGFFPLYASACGSHRAIGVDPDSVRVKRASEIAKFANNSAEFITDRFKTDISDQLGVFDIVYVGSAYHYFWLDHRDSFKQSAHEAIFEGLARLTGEILIFEGCTNLDDDAWRSAVLKQTKESEDKIRSEFNDDVIMKAANKYFEIQALGQSGIGTHRYLFTMTKKSVSVPVPFPPNAQSLLEQPLTRLKIKTGSDRAGEDESVFSLQAGGRTYVKKVLSKRRAWCLPAFAILEKAFKPPGSYPKGLVKHYFQLDQGSTVALFQEYVENHSPLSSTPNPRSLQLRQRLAYIGMSMQRALVTAGLIHIDIHETNVLLVGEDVKFIDFEGLVATHTHFYRDRFSNFYTLNFIAFIEALFNTGVSRATLEALNSVEMYGNNISEEGVTNILSVVRAPADLTEVYEAILKNPPLLLNIGLYELLLRRLPALIGRVKG